MQSLFLAALLATASGADASGPSLDVRCFQLMAELAESDDPRLRSAGMVGAQYFLGRLDGSGAAGGPDEVAALQPHERNGLLQRCSAAMEASGRDFRALGEALRAPPSSPSA